MTTPQITALIARLKDAYEDIRGLRADCGEVDVLFHAIDTAAANLSEALVIARAMLVTRGMGDQ